MTPSQRPSSCAALLCDILEPDLAHRPTDCATVTRVMSEISARIDSDLCLVDPEPG